MPFDNFHLNQMLLEAVHEPLVGSLTTPLDTIGAATLNLLVF